MKNTEKQFALEKILQIQILFWLQN